MRRRTTTLFLVITLFAWAATALAAAELEAPKVIAVKFHADWCGSCKAMGSVLEDLRNKYDGRPVLFVTLDQTNRSTSHQAQLMASALGLEKAWAQHGGKTGFILLIDGQNGVILERLAHDQPLKAMASSLDSFLSK